MDKIIEYLETDSLLPAGKNNCYAFSKGSDVINGMHVAFGNMVSCPLEVEGQRFFNSEAAYIAGLFGLGSAECVKAQHELLTETNGFRAKKFIRGRYADFGRADWHEFNLHWMLYVVWCKCVTNAGFRNMLLALPHDALIIEDATNIRNSTATFWGMVNMEHRQLSKALRRMPETRALGKNARKQQRDRKRLGEWRSQGCYQGKNVMGKILMICRDALLGDTVPDIDFGLLRSKQIYWYGQILDFSDVPQLASPLQPTRA